MTWDYYEKSNVKIKAFKKRKKKKREINLKNETRVPLSY